ncbi:MAG: DUF1330 domain-containing protein [Rhizobiales bacterium]|nr:DUF1330 domain-containing protein [Hyphomicrobiales bacterium]
MPKGYIIGEIEVTNLAGYETYRRQSPKIAEQFGGRYLVRGGDAKLLEGVESIKRPVVIEFESYERALAFYTSPEYQEILPHRLENVKTMRLICADGI